MCKETNQSVVPDFTVSGFDGPSSQLTAAHAQLKDLKALKMSVCVGASYNPSTNKICFSVPIYGDICITSPISIPVGAELKVCASTCGAFIPTGLKATVYLNGSAIYTGTIIGSC
ncbi:hypothetical protein AB4090_02665 [Acidithiobacillus sp. IBUN Pt1247-S3]|uniref:hypothetical protein n=1 Tax=Acidithiobacillus sp. IBUN Pt1247-S3 TaxID=3166642 RepID=UPI0034E60794